MPSSSKKFCRQAWYFPTILALCLKPSPQIGDPLDVLLLMDEPAFPGCAVHARLIGVIEGEQLAGKKKIQNDRLVACR